MELLDKDLNLLRVFLAIWEERSLSKAGARLHISQSAVSHALSRMRAEFGDALFVRNSKGVAPTDFSEAMAPKVRALMRQLEEMYSGGRAFDPKKVKRKFTLAAGDYFSITKLDAFVARLATEAPSVKLICRPILNIFHLDKFEKGEIDLAITAINVATKEGFHSHELSRDEIYVCARKNHPQVKLKLSAETYLSLKHLNVSNYGSEEGVVDEYLAPLGKKREVSLVTSSFFDAARLLRSTDLVLSAPQKICEGLSREYGLNAYPLPFRFGARPISMIWHERTHGDPFHSWIRKLILSA
ncbi:MAG: LysR family transcriptional regulator [Proteobacteria bacterium]|nr:MAG: LysR family transcriptional regulator [Pseudomonadota bacterium]